MRKHRYHRFEQLEAYDRLRDQYAEKLTEFATADPIRAAILDTEILMLKVKMAKRYSNISQKRR